MARTLIFILCFEIQLRYGAKGRWKALWLQPRSAGSSNVIFTFRTRAARAQALGTQTGPAHAQELLCAFGVALLTNVEKCLLGMRAAGSVFLVLKYFCLSLSPP